MSTSNTSWDDTSFDDEDGFREDSPREETWQEHAAAEDLYPHEPTEDAAIYPPTLDQTPAEALPTRTPEATLPPTPLAPTPVTPTPVPPPPVPEKRSRWGTAFLVTALLLIVLAGGYIVSTFFMRDPAEQEAFYADPETDEQAPIPPPVDTVTVSESSPKTTDSVLVDNSVRQPLTEAPKKPVDVAPKRPSVPREPKEKVEPTAPKEPKKTAPANALYVVQVFSSPSRDDADEWLQILRERSVSDGFITEQKLGGESWYRVRFGQYNTRADAEAAAQQLGFSNPWIARVR